LIAKQNIISPYPEIYPGVTKVLREQLAQGVKFHFSGGIEHVQVGDQAINSQFTSIGI